MTAEDIQMIIDLILQWGPSIVSIITMICTVIMTIKKVASSNDANLNKLKEIEAGMVNVLKENADLKKDLKKMTNKIYKIKATEE
jgi:hypothetical protein